MIAIVNNCELFEELGQELKSRWWKPGQHDSEATIKFENLLSIFQNLKSEAAGYLLDEAFLDIEIQFAKLMTPGIYYILKINVSCLFTFHFSPRMG